MFDILPGTLYHWYRDHISDYHSDKSSGKWPDASIPDVDEDTGEILKEQPVPILKPENIGGQMCIDDKAIGRDGYTILSNTQTGKIAMMIESTKSAELEAALSNFGDDLKKIKSISCDMSPTYLKLCREQLPQAETVVDKFHVMQYLYDAVLDVRSRIRKKLAEGLSKGKKKTDRDREILREMELLKRCRLRLTQSAQKWSEQTTELMKHIFSKYKELKTVYDLSQDFKNWYDRSSCLKDKTWIQESLYLWYHQVKEAGLDEMMPVVKMIRKHEDKVMNYFTAAHTNAKAESLNGKIQRFVAANYGVRDKDFALYRIAGYFS
jgi:transposase